MRKILLDYRQYIGSSILIDADHCPDNDFFLLEIASDGWQEPSYFIDLSRAELEGLAANIQGLLDATKNEECKT